MIVTVGWIGRGWSTRVGELDREECADVIWYSCITWGTPSVPDIGIPGIGTPDIGIPGMGIPGIGIPVMGIPGIGTGIPGG